MIRSIRSRENRIEDPTQSLALKLQALGGKAEILHASDYFDRVREVHKHALTLIENATGIVGLDTEKEKAVINWAHTWAFAGDYISAATIYDQVINHPYISEEMKPQIIMWKVNSLKQLFMEHGEEEEFLPEETAVLVHELNRLVNNYSKTDPAIEARVQVAELVKDSTPEMAKQYLGDAVAMYENYIKEPPDEEYPVWAMLKIAEAYIRTEQHDQAKKAAERVLQAYSKYPRVTQEAQGMLAYIRRQEMEAQQRAAQEAVSATGTVSATESIQTASPAPETATGTQ